MVEFAIGLIVGVALGVFAMSFAVVFIEDKPKRKG